MKLWLVRTAILGLLTLLGCSSNQPSSPAVPRTDSISDTTVHVTPQSTERDWFEDRTPGSGVEFRYRNGEEADLYTLLESLGGGVGLIDYDRDGKLDLMFTGGGVFPPGNPTAIRGLSNKLYRNLGNWKFEDVTSKTGLDQPLFYSHGVAVGDFNCDGWPDLFVTGYRRVALYQNCPAPDAASGRVFREITREAGIPLDLPWSTSAAFGDFNGDGYPELFICQYVDWSFAKHKTCAHSSTPKDVCTPHDFEAVRSFLFQNNGNGTFTDISAKQRLASNGKGLGVVIADLDGDRRPDIYVANDASANHYYTNHADGTLVECGQKVGIDVDETGHVNGSMGIAVADWDRSERPSLLVTNFQNEWHAFYQNLGQGRFQYRTHAAGLAKLGQRYVGFGVTMTDFDHDGWEDLVIANGHVLRHPNGSTLSQNPILMKNASEGSKRKFLEITGEGGTYFRSLHRGRGLAVGDLDNDGRPDIVISHQNEPVVLLRNRPNGSTEKQYHGVSFQLGSEKNRDLVGSRVCVTINGQRLTRCLGRGGYLSTNSDRLHFGLGAADKIDHLEVTWSYGKTQHWEGPITVDCCWHLIENSQTMTK